MSAIKYPPLAQYFHLTKALTASLSTADVSPPENQQRVVGTAAFPGCF